LKKILFVILSSSGALGLCTGTFASSLNLMQISENKNIVLASKQFKCDGRQYCSQMTSRAEAEFFLKNCPNTKMDGDKDGVPCENDSRF